MRTLEEEPDPYFGLKDKLKIHESGVVTDDGGHAFSSLVMQRAMDIDRSKCIPIKQLFNEIDKEHGWA